MFLVIALLLLSISIVAFSLYTGISPMPSSSMAQKIIAASIDPQGNIIYELGSGWGGLAFTIAATLPESRVFAFELSYLPWLYSSVKLKLKRNKNTHFLRKDFFKYPISQADIIVCYLYPKAMEKLRIKFERELKPGTLIISNTFAIPGWKPIRVISLNNLWKTQILIYRT
jgi:16S rRNA A1518/A1519 N6-dimethyltransferase RsmA/KsgA/DIM1 with predicted DNA glycosylase/AP lyase activity